MNGKTFYPKVLERLTALETKSDIHNERAGEVRKEVKGGIKDLTERVDYLTTSMSNSFKNLKCQSNGVWIKVLSIAVGALYTLVIYTLVIGA